MNWRSKSIDLPQHRIAIKMKLFRIGLFAIILMQMATTACQAAANACTNMIKLRDDLTPCVDQVAESATKAGLQFQRNRNTYFFWINNDVIVAKCVSGGIDSLVVLFSYLGGKPEGACPLLDRVRDVLPGFTVE